MEADNREASAIAHQSRRCHVALLNSATVSLKCLQGSLSLMELSGTVKCSQHELFSGYPITDVRPLALVVSTLMLRHLFPAKMEEGSRNAAINADTNAN